PAAWRTHLTGPGAAPRRVRLRDSPRWSLAMADRRLSSGPRSLHGLRADGCRRRLPLARPRSIAVTRRGLGGQRRAADVV
ncbi:hypothetical protein IscW_ISCW005466, partial [Ixodes scapularis]